MKKLILMFLAAAFLSGCSTDYFKDAAVDRAREYIYDNCPNMSVQNESFIRYTYPRIETSPIFISAKGEDNKPYNQVCFAWDMPSTKATIVVVGSCGNYLDWRPIRMIVKNAEPPPVPVSVSAPNKI